MEDMVSVPAMGDSSKGKQLYRAKILLGFRPRNGEVILKIRSARRKVSVLRFRPRNGEAILKTYKVAKGKLVLWFPSPQWGGNSKGKVSALPNLNERFRPHDGEVILKKQ